jgi:hypothetical protein
MNRRVYLVIGLVVSLFVSLAASGIAAAQEGGSLTPSYGNGMLAIVGEGFRPNAHIDIKVTVGGTTREVNARADQQGRFQLETGIPVPPGTSVELAARDGTGSGAASITSGPPLLLPPATNITTEPRQLPRSGIPGSEVVIALAGMALGLGLAAIVARRGRHA